jgi:acyl carrier protein
MGLDIVEIVIQFEEDFGVRIPDADAGELVTPRDFIDYFCARLPMAADAPCPSQRAFYLLRRPLVLTQKVTRRAVRLDSGLASLTGGKRDETLVDDLLRGLDARSRPRLNRIGAHRRLRRVRDLVPFAETSSQVRWTRAVVARKVKTTVVEQLGLRESEYWEDAHFIRDLGAG